MKKGRGKVLGIALLIGLAATLLTEISGQTAIVHLLHLKSRDLYFVAKSPEKPDNLLLLVVDQKSIDRFPEPLLFWHQYYAEAIEAAAEAGARVLGLDVAFPIPVDQWVQGLDQRMAEAVISTSSRMPVLAGYAVSTLAQQRQWPVPMNMAAAALGQTVYVNLRADEDDFIRSIELFEPAGSRSMSLGVAERYLGRELKVADRVLIINYAGPAGTIPRVSLSDFVEASRAGRKDQLRQWVAGKAVLLGPDLITDRHATPYYAFRAGTPANTAGVEIHANSVHTLLTGKYLTELKTAPKAVLLLLLACSAALVTTIIAGWLLFGWLSLLGAVAGASGYLLFRGGVLVAPSELLLCMLFSTLLSLLISYFSAARRRDAFRKAVSVFVGKQVAEALDATGTIGLSGGRQMVTILFTDIRGFTAWCDTQEPETVVARLNEYFAVMTGCIVRHGGHVNKFIGDGIMAIFSDSEGKHLGDHAERAVRCAMEMVQDQGDFKTGAGIHTGFAVVGNVGSGDKMDYTALGDTVNLAARLESLNKEFKTKLLMSETTYLRVCERIAGQRLGEVTVRGKSAQQALYTVPEV